MCNIGVYPYAEVQVYVSSYQSDKPRVTINVENFGERYEVDPANLVYDRHPLLEASIDILELTDLSFEVNLFSLAPAGCSTGTSAAVTVALLGALDRLTTVRRTPHEIAALAHRVETEKLDASAASDLFLALRQESNADERQYHRRREQDVVQRPQNVREQFCRQYCQCAVTKGAYQREDSESDQEGLIPEDLPGQGVDVLSIDNQHGGNKRHGRIHPETVSQQAASISGSPPERLFDV